MSKLPLRSLALDLVGVTGAVCLVVGAAQAWTPAGWITAGALALALWTKAVSK